LREQVRAEAKSGSLGEMSAGLAHEFKNAMLRCTAMHSFCKPSINDEQGQTAADALLQEVRNLQR